MNRLTDDEIKKVLADEYKALEIRKEELRERTKNSNLNFQEKQVLFQSILDKEFMQIEVGRIWIKLFNVDNINSVNEILKELDK